MLCYAIVCAEFISHCAPQVNIINREVLSEFKDVASKIQIDPNVRAVVISSAKHDNFIAGADIEYVDSRLISVLANF